MLIPFIPPPLRIVPDRMVSPRVRGRHVCPCATPAITAGALIASRRLGHYPASGASHDQTELAIHWFARVRWL